MAQTDLVQTVNGVTIRKATHADIPVLEAFIAGFVDSGELLPRTLTELHDLLGNFFIAVDEDDELVGCATWSMSPKCGDQGTPHTALSVTSSFKHVE